MREKNVGMKLISIYQLNEDYETRVSIVTALGRFHGAEVVKFLETVSQWPIMEWIMGRNKALKLAAKASLGRATGSA